MIVKFKVTGVRMKEDVFIETTGKTTLQAMFKAEEEVTKLRLDWDEIEYVDSFIEEEETEREVWTYSSSYSPKESDNKELLTKAISDVLAKSLNSQKEEDNDNKELLPKTMSDIMAKPLNYKKE